MTDAEFRAFVAQARAEVDAELARLDALDWESMDPDERATMEEPRLSRCNSRSETLVFRRFVC